jgi:signal-transduction protein with cAMP-binding, CBS, and nucleotidyltransferase domain
MTMPDSGDLEEQLLSEVSELMSRQIHAVPADASLREASRLMEKFNVGSLLVLRDGQYIGILTDTDLARKGLAKGVDPEKDKVQSLMSSPIITIDCQRLVEEARALMKSKGIRHLAVTEEGKIVGIISLGDLIRYYAANFKMSE